MSVIHRAEKRSDRGTPRASAASPQASSSSSSQPASSSPALAPGANQYPQILPSDRERVLLVKRNGKTDPAYGISPEKRSLKMHMSLGAINLDKTSWPTSHEVAAWVKRILEVDDRVSDRAFTRVSGQPFERNAATSCRVGDPAFDPGGYRASPPALMACSPSVAPRIVACDNSKEARTED